MNSNLLRQPHQPFISTWLQPGDPGSPTSREAVSTASTAGPAEHSKRNSADFKLNPSRSAFTLIEMIGVLAIIALLVAALLPRWIKRIDLAVERAEVKSLKTISSALTAQVLRGTNLFDKTTWVGSAADWTLLPQVKVSQNARRKNRFYFYEENANPAAGYEQTWQGFQNPPQNLRAVLVSVLGGEDLDAGNTPPTSDGEIDDTYFNELWNLPGGERPVNGLWANWNGQGDDFLVERINYRPLFHHLVLLNRDPSVEPRFQISGSAAQPVARAQNNAGWNAYYLEGSVVSLCDPNGYKMTDYVLRQDISFVWEAGKWRAEILGAPESDTISSDFAAKAKEFLEATRYTKAFKGANQQGVVTAMYDFMFSYVFWSNECPLFTTHDVSHVQVAEYRLLNWLGANNGRLDEFSLNLVNK